MNPTTSSAPLRFPLGFLWGAGTSAHQVEGGNRANDWWRFEHEPGAIADASQSGDACRHWERFDQDFALAQADRHNAHRFSIEWSRIEPEPGRIDGTAVAHYHQVLASLARHRLTPVVTLHHFTNPLWIADQGGWESRHTIDAFERFVRFCAREFGSEVDWWCTVNEPEVYAFRAYSEGLWPPRRRDDRAALAVMANLLEAHGRAYRVLHQEDRWDTDGDGHPVRAGFTKHLVQLEGDRWWMPLDGIRARIEDQVFNQAVNQAAIHGDIDLWVPGARRVKRHVPELAGAMDYFGLNYYTRWRVRSTGKVPHVARSDAPLNDLGWEIWPQGLAHAAERAAKIGMQVAQARATDPGAKLPTIPVLITEHGVADATDRLRPQALHDSLTALARTIHAGTPVIGYLHWSLLDNFEWADGYKGRFGLYSIDFKDPTLERHHTRSAEIYARIIEANAVV